MSTMLAIDQSTSATKAVLFNADGAVIDKSAREHRQIYPQPGWVEHDADEIWRNVVEVVRELARRNADPMRNVAGVAIANQRETFVVFDRSTGRPVRNAIVWQCRRGDAICQDLVAAGCEAAVREKTGLKLDAYFTGSKLKWLIDNDPEVRAGLATGALVVGTMDAYLIHRFTHGKVFATDSTNASRTLLYDIGALRWDGQLLELFGASPRSLPEVRPSAAQFGATDCDGALPHPVPICGVMGDSQASLFAQQCFHPGMAKATFGSGTSLLLNVGPLPPSDPSAGSVVALAWVVDGTPVYALEGLINFSAATVSWLKNQLGLIDDAADAETLAASVEDAGGVYLVPAFAGLGAPHWNPAARAAIVGLTAHSRREHIVRAALESIAYQVRDVLQMMHREARVSPAVMFADGGPTHNEFLMQFTADVARVDLIVAEVAQSSALGAAMMGMLGQGVYSSLDQLAAIPRLCKTYRPRMSDAQVERLTSGWSAAVQRVM